MSTIENFVLGLEGQQKSIVQYLHQRITQHHDLLSKLSYKIPFYYRRSWVCYLNPLKSGGVELAFPRGNQLSNDQQLIDMKNRKYVGGIDLFELSNIPEREIDEIIQEAIILDDIHKKLWQA